MEKSQHPICDSLLFSFDFIFTDAQNIEIERDDRRGLNLLEHNPISWCINFFHRLKRYEMFTNLSFQFSMHCCSSFVH